MPRISESFDPQAVDWWRVADPDCKDYKIDFEYSLHGYDLAGGRLDMVYGAAPEAAKASAA